MAELKFIHRDYDSEGVQIGYVVGYVNGGVGRRVLYLSAAGTEGLSNAQIKALAQTRADADNSVAGSDFVFFDAAGEARSDYAAFVSQAQNELDYLASTIPTIDAMTAAQVRTVVKRLAQENQGIIRALLYLAKRLE